MKNLIQIVSHEKRQAQVNMNLRVSQILSVNTVSPTTIADIIAQEQNQGKPQPGAGANDPIGRLSEMGRASQMPPEFFQTIDELRPKDTDYVFPLFRALSATIVEGYWLDYSTPGMLEAAVPLLQGQTVYTDHRYWRVADWVGVVNKSIWDAKGEQSGGAPGINAELKIDWRKNPWIARGLMMTPPAIHSVSVTVLFEYDFSHPDLVEQDRFWDLMGQEVDGHIVRLIVTKILGFWELSLVFQGADTQAKQIEGEYSENSAARRGLQQQQKEKATVKLSVEQKQKLGLTAHASEEVPDATVLQAVDRLAVRAEAGDRFVTSQRAECVRVATLAIVGAADGKLPDALAKVISQAGAEELEGLITMYTEQAEQRFPATCQHCGSKEIKGRSSVEERTEVDKAAQTKPSRKPVPANPIF